MGRNRLKDVFSTNPPLPEIKLLFQNTEAEAQFEKAIHLALDEGHPVNVEGVNGIVAYDSNKPHAIALTDYDAETDTFYCSDPAECCVKARVPVSEAIISLENVDVVWYVTSPSNLSAPVMAAAEANEAEENTEAQSVIPEIETAPVTSLDNLSHTELKLEMN